MPSKPKPVSIQATIAGPLPHADRHALGLAARKQVARSALADFTAKSCNPDPLALLTAAERGRLPKLLAIKHERMAASAFGFFRGAVPIMAADLSVHPNTGITTQLCGDAHVSNLGAYAGPDGRLVFDINDFDESLRGPFEFDVKRLATSLILAGRDAHIGRSARRYAVARFTRQYRKCMHAFAAMPVLELARWQIHRIAELDPMPAILRQAERSTPQRNLKSITELISSNQRIVISTEAKRSGETRRSLGEGAIGTRRFQSHPPLLTRLSAKEADLVLASLGPYARTLQPERRHFLAQYRPVDVAFKVVGTGSVGLRDYCVYLEGTHHEEGPLGSTDPLFLQIKEETASAYAQYLPDGDAHTHQGHRAMDGQRAMQLTSDPFLGYTTIEGRDYLVRQLNDHKASLDLTTLTAESLTGYAELCGELFARGHARAGDPVAISAYIGDNDRFDQAILEFARLYADKTEHDWSLLKTSMKAGR